MKTLLMLAAAGLLSNPATAPEPAKPLKTDPNRMICKRVEPAGTRIGHQRVCMTAIEWKNAQQADRDAVDRIQRSTCVSGAGC